MTTVDGLAKRFGEHTAVHKLSFAARAGEVNPRRPLKLVGIGIGRDDDPAELKAIAEATGGQAFTAPDPTTIGGVFYAALSRVLCQPPTCKPANGSG